MTLDAAQEERLKEGNATVDSIEIGDGKLSELAAGSLIIKDTRTCKVSFMSATYV